MPHRVGVVSIQGDFSKHLGALARLPNVEGKEVRSLEDLAEVERLIIPGGESTTVGMLMQRYGLGEAIIKAAATGMPIWGTCMGMILLAKEVEGYEQYRLGLLDVTVQRNAFGAQVHSFEDTVSMTDIDSPVLGVFIRAPIVTRLGENVVEMARYDDKIVAVRQGKVLGTSFHPELTEDLRVHEYFLSL